METPIRERFFSLAVSGKGADHQGQGWLPAHGLHFLLGQCHSVASKLEGRGVMSHQNSKSQMLPTMLCSTYHRSTAGISPLQVSVVSTPQGLVFDDYL